MAKTSEATLKAIKKYNQKSKFINIKYTPNSLDDYDRISQYCKKNNLSLQGYIKNLIKTDLDSKGFYATNDNNNNDGDNDNNNVITDNNINNTNDI